MKARIEDQALRQLRARPRGLLPAMFAIAPATDPAADPSVHDCWATRD